MKDDHETNTLQVNVVVRFNNTGIVTFKANSAVMYIDPCTIGA